MAETWKRPNGNTRTDTLIEDIGNILRRVSNASMPRSGGGKNGKRQAYWWNGDIAKLRSEYLAARRVYIKLRRKGNNKCIETAKNKIRKARKKINKSILKAKDDCWKELLATLEADLWGMPYKIVTRKLISSGRSICKSLTCRGMRIVVDGLFPIYNTQGNDDDLSNIVWLDEHNVIDVELKNAMSKLNGNKKAPGRNLRWHPQERGTVSRGIY